MTRCTRARARDIVAELKTLPANRQRVAALEAVIAAITDRELLEEIMFQLPRDSESVSTRHHNDMLITISERDEVLFLAARRARLAGAA